jgi:hypothetical protein
MGARQTRSRGTERSASLPKGTLPEPDIRTPSGQHMEPKAHRPKRPFSHGAEPSVLDTSQDLGKLKEAAQETAAKGRLGGKKTAQRPQWTETIEQKEAESAQARAELEDQRRARGTQSQINPTGQKVGLQLPSQPALDTFKPLQSGVAKNGDGVGVEGSKTEVKVASNVEVIEAGLEIPGTRGARGWRTAQTVAPRKKSARAPPSKKLAGCGRNGRCGGNEMKA